MVDSDDGGIAPYEAGRGYSELSGGGRRRKGRKSRKSRKSRRKGRKSRRR